MAPKVGFLSQISNDIIQYLNGLSIIISIMATRKVRAHSYKCYQRSVRCPIALRPDSAHTFSAISSKNSISTTLHKNSVLSVSPFVTLGRKMFFSDNGKQSLTITHCLSSAFAGARLSTGRTDGVVGAGGPRTSCPGPCP